MISKKQKQAGRKQTVNKSEKRRNNQRKRKRKSIPHTEILIMGKEEYLIEMIDMVAADERNLERKSKKMKKYRFSFFRIKQHKRLDDEKEIKRKRKDDFFKR